MTEVWFTNNERYGDLSGGCLFSPKKCLSSQEVDDFLVTQHNSVVGPDDVVFHIGGFGRPTLANALVLDRLNGAQHIYCRERGEPDNSAYLNIGFHVVHNGFFGASLAAWRHLKNPELTLTVECNRFSVTCLQVSRRTPNAETACLFMLPLDVSANDYKPVSLSYISKRSEELYLKTVQDALDETLKKFT